MFLSHLDLRGFRGAGDAVSLDFGKRTIIIGPNGSGKTSILQSIPWAIYGKLPKFTGTVFTREDALVNDFFEPAEAAVTATFSDGLQVTRTRSKQISTTRGSSVLTLAGTNADSQESPEDLIGLSLEEFFAAAYLSQETIREFITTTPDQRGTTIDRMLGTYLLRALVRAVDVKLVAEAVDGARNRIDTIDQQLTQASILNRELIQQRKEQYGEPTEIPTLLESAVEQLLPALELLSIERPEPTSQSLVSAIEACRKRQVELIAELTDRRASIDALKERFEQEIVLGRKALQERKSELGDPDRLSALMDDLALAIESVSDQLGVSHPTPDARAYATWLGSARSAQITQISELEQTAAKLAGVQARIERASDELLEAEEIPGTLIETQKGFDEHISELRGNLAALTQAQSSRNKAWEARKALDEQLAELPELQEKAQILQTAINGIESDMKRGTLHTQLMSVGVQYLEDFHPEHCPLCRQRIESLSALLAAIQREAPPDIEQMRREFASHRNDLTKVQERLSALAEHQRRSDALDKELAAIPDDLDQQIDETAAKIEAHTKQLTSVIGEINEIQARIDAADASRERWIAATQEVENLLGHTPGENVMDDLRQYNDSLRARIEAVKALDFGDVTEQIEDAKNLAQLKDDEAIWEQRWSKLLTDIETVVGTSVSSEDEVVSALRAAIQNTVQTTQSISAIDIRPVEAVLDRVEHLEAIEHDEQQLREFETSFQTVQREKRRLNFSMQRLVELRNALLDISETAKSKQQEIVLQLIQELDIDRFYEQLAPHPVYSQLRLEPELTNRGTFNYWIKAVSSDLSRDTHIQTRFSTAQANAAAIAIFLAVNQRLSKALETVILDDPSQSMDKSYKQRLARTLSTSSRQVVVATEDEQLFEALTLAFDDCTVYELAPWTSEGVMLQAER